MTDQESSFEERKWQHEQQIEERKWLYELKREDAKRAHDANREFHSYVNKEAVGASNLTLRTLVVINGGAAIAVLTFLGGVAARDKIDLAQVGLVANTIKWFSFGVALAVVGMALSYLTHYATAAVFSSRITTWEHPYVTDGPTTVRWWKINRIFHVTAIAVAIASQVLFVIGMFNASDSITHMLLK